MDLPAIVVYRLANALVVRRADEYFFLDETIDALFSQKEPALWLRAQLTSAATISADIQWLAPIGTQEVWAAGVTYLRSRNARIDESTQTGGGGGDFYDKVYDAPRPELFFKATPHRVIGPEGKVRIRSDAKWSVPEPELTLAINARGRIFGYTIGNDMSSRDIEGENPLYLPQAKVYAGSCALGPGITVRDSLPPETTIEMEIKRNNVPLFSGTTSLSKMKRQFSDLVDYLFRDNEFPAGCFLLTGTGIVPPNEFTLASGDSIRIAISGIGTLSNVVE